MFHSEIASSVACYQADKVDTLVVEGNSVSAEIRGIALMGGKMYVVCEDMNVVYEYENKRPYEKCRVIEITQEDFTSPRDLVACQQRICLFVSCEKSKAKCSVWRLDVGTSHLEPCLNDLDRPATMSCTGDKLLVVTHEVLLVYNIDNMSRLTSFRMSYDIYHAIETKDEGYIVSRGSNNWLEREVRQLIKVSEEFKVKRQVDCTKALVHTKKDECREYDCDLTKTQSDSSETCVRKNLKPVHIAIDSVGNVFVADIQGSQIVVFNSELKKSFVLLNTDINGRPARLCFDESFRHLYVGLTGSAASVYIYKLHATSECVTPSTDSSSVTVTVPAED